MNRPRGSCEYVRAAPDGFVVYSGNDVEFGDFVRAGGTGAVSGVSSVFPRRSSPSPTRCAAATSRPPAAAQDRVKQAVDAVAGADIALIKAGLALQGLPAGPHVSRSTRRRPRSSTPSAPPSRSSHDHSPARPSAPPSSPGASPRGIGRATADRLARDGWSVAILDIDGVAAKLAAADVADTYSVPTLGVGADISDENAVDAAVAPSSPPCRRSSGWRTWRG